MFGLSFILSSLMQLLPSLPISTLGLWQCMHGFIDIESIQCRIHVLEGCPCKAVRTYCDNFPLKPSWVMRVIFRPNHPKLIYKYTWCCMIVSAIITQISQEWYTNLYLRKNIFARHIPQMDSLYVVKTLSTYLHPYGRIREHRLACNWMMCSCNLNDDAAWPRPDVQGWEIRMGTSSKILQ
jgi:hypothetical protein